MHFLRAGEVQARVLWKNRAAVQVRLRGKDTLVIEPGIFVMKRDVQLSLLPERVKVVGPDDKPVKPSKGKQFYVTVETFDPMHMVAEASPDELF